MAAAVTKKRNTPFQITHEGEFGLIVKARTTHGIVSSVACRFCFVFGKEEKEGSVRAAPLQTKYFTAPFRTELYRKHLKNFHPLRWAEVRNIVTTAASWFAYSDCVVSSSRCAVSLSILRECAHPVLEHHSCSHGSVGGSTKVQRAQDDCRRHCRRDAH